MNKAPNTTDPWIPAIFIGFALIAVLMIGAVVVGSTMGHPTDPITQGEVTDKIYNPASSGGPRYVGGRPAGTRSDRAAEWSIIVKGDDGRRRLWLSEGLYNQLALGDELTMQENGLITSINGVPYPN